MRRDSRLSLALHALLHLKEHGEPVTSEAIGAMLATNPVVLRRTLAGLRDAGILRSEKGHGGGWSLARELADISLGDVYDALGLASPFRIGNRAESPGCVVERAVNRALGTALGDAEALFVSRLRQTSVADLLADARRGLAQWKKRQQRSGSGTPSKNGPHSHA